MLEKDGKIINKSGYYFVEKCVFEEFLKRSTTEVIAPA
jgi:hypothetical protein